MDTRLVGIQNLMRQMARTGFTPGGSASGSDFGGDTRDGGHGTGDGGHC